jgi:Ser/Thr protein kinase RdoA (MazF antagonist)
MELDRLKNRKGNVDWQQVSDEEMTTVRGVLALYKLMPLSIAVSNIAGANIVYRVKTKEGVFVLRKSQIIAAGAKHEASQYQHCLFQVEILTYLAARQCNFVPKVYPDGDGHYVCQCYGGLYMLFSYGDGKRKGNWNDSADITPRMLASFFEMLGTFHKALFHFTPQNATKEKGLFDYAQVANDWLLKIINEAPITTHEIIEPLMPKPKEFASGNVREMQMLSYNNLPKQVVHFDYHYGNVHFLNEHISAIFDLDWARVDCRFADIGASLSMICPYGGSRDARLTIETIKCAYNPSNGEFFVSFVNTSNSEAQISNSDMLGRKVYIQSITDGGRNINHVVNAGNLLCGLYLLTLQTAEETFTKKIVIR